MTEGRAQRNYVSSISNDSSPGGDNYFDAVENLEKQRMHGSAGGASSGFGSNNSRARSSSAGTLVPTPAAAELMAALASSDSGKKIDLTEFSTAAECETSGSVALDEGQPGGSLGLSGFYGDRSRNPFARADNRGAAHADPGATAAATAATAAAADGIAGGYARRKWPPPGHQQPPRMVVLDISSTDTTPVHTPVGSGGGGGGSRKDGGGDAGGSTALSWDSITASPSPLRPPRPPPRPSFRGEINTLNPFTEEFESTAAAAVAQAAARGVSASCTNPFVTCTEAPPNLNPFADEQDSPTSQPDRGDEGVSGGGEACFHAEGALAARDAVVGGGAVEEAPAMVESVATATATAGESKSRPPPLPPRRTTSPTHTRTALSGGGAGARGGEGKISIGPASPRSALSSATCDSGEAVDPERSGGMDARSVGSASSTASDSASGRPGKKYMVVNQDTGQKFDVRELEQHLPADNYTLLPSRKDLIELERLRSAGASGAVARSPPTSPSPRTSLPSALAASVAVAVGKTNARREKAKHLGSMMRKKLGKVASAAGAAATAASSGHSGGGDGNLVTAAEGGGDAPKAVAPGAAGDRGSGGMGAAARAVSGALAGIRVSLKGKESSETLAGLMLFQELRCHDGPIWAAAFNHSGQFLATAGQDMRILLHKVGDLREDLGDGSGDGDGGGGGEATKADCTTPTAAGGAASAPGAAGDETEGRASGAAREPGCSTPKASSGKAEGDASTERAIDSGSRNSGDASDGSRRPTSGSAASDDANATGAGGRRGSGRRASATVVIDTTPWQILEAHRGDVVALAWSRNDFLLSASLDKTVRLWHTTQGHCLHFFKHADIVTSVDFHPLFEHFFLSGCFDKKIRVWNIRDGRVQEWQQAPDMVTAAKFSLDGQMIVAGLYMGQVLFYQTEGMRYFTQIECRNRRGTKKRGRKVSGFAFKKTGLSGKDGSGKSAGRDDSGGAGDSRSSPSTSPGARRSVEGLRVSVGGDATAAVDGSSGGGGVGGSGGAGVGPGAHIPEQLLVTTNDSRLRLYNTDDFGMNAKYKGFSNDTLQITASFSEDGKQIISGSENGKVYVWSTGVFAKPSPSSLPGTPTPASSTAAGQPTVPPAVAPTQKDTNRCHESFQATSEPPRIVTSAIFVPESTTRACVTAVRGCLSKDMSESGGYCGAMILATDYNGVLRVYCKSAVFLS